MGHLCPAAQSCHSLWGCQALGADWGAPAPRACNLEPRRARSVGCWLPPSCFLSRNSTPNMMSSTGGREQNAQPTGGLESPSKVNCNPDLSSPQWPACLAVPLGHLGRQVSQGSVGSQGSISHFTECGCGLSLTLLESLHRMPFEPSPPSGTECFCLVWTGVS